MKIIACDDERPGLENLTIAIREAVPSCELTTFRYPGDVLQYAKDYSFDVAFLDISMPEMSGIELAKELKKILPNLNVIFVTAYSIYAIDAVNIHASGYVMKPVSKEAVEKEMNNLLHPIGIDGDMYVQTFGQFEVFVQGRPLKFVSAKCKEMFAYLVDKDGASVNRKELSAALFLDEPYTLKVQNYFSKIVKALVESLRQAGFGHILIREYNSYAIQKDAFVCDLYEYEKGNPTAINKYHGEYMTQYEWADGKDLGHK